MATTAPPPSIPKYRQELRKALPDAWFQPHPGALWWLIPHAAIIGTGLWILASQGVGWWAPLVSLAIGHSFGCLGFLGHELSHGSVLRHPRWREALAAVCFSPFWIGPMLWRKWHNADHHNHTQIEGVDPDHLFTLEAYQEMPVLRFLYRLSPLLRNLVIFGSFTFRMTQQALRMFFLYIKPVRSTARERLIMIVQLLVPILFWVGGTLALGPHVLLWGYLLPLLVGNAMVISYIATNHFLNPLADERDVLATSLTVTLPKPLAWLDAWHLRFGAHVAHHLFPQVPTRHARQVEAKIAELWPDRYHSMSLFKALRLLWQTPWVYEDQKTLIDPQKQERSPTLGSGLENR